MVGLARVCTLKDGEWEALSLRVHVPLTWAPLPTMTYNFPELVAALLPHRRGFQSFSHSMRSRARSLHKGTKRGSMTHLSTILCLQFPALVLPQMPSSSWGRMATTRLAAGCRALRVDLLYDQTLSALPG